MKTYRLGIAAAILMICFSQNTLMAQKKISIPEKNNFAVELNFKSFGENVISFNQLQFKYKITDDVALRPGLAFDNCKLNQPAI